MYVILAFPYPRDQGVTQSLKCNTREKSRSRYETPTSASNPNQRQPAYKREAFLDLSPNPIQAVKIEEYFILLRLPINEVFHAVNDQPWIKQLNMIQYNPTLSGKEECCSYHDSKGHQIVYCRILWKYLEELVHQGFLTPSSLRCRGVKRSTSYPTATHDQPVQDNWVIWSFQWRQRSTSTINAICILIKFNIFYLIIK